LMLKSIEDSNVSATNHHLLNVALKELRPTQITVGFAEVLEKRSSWQLLPPHDRKPFLLSHCFPAVLGPKSQIYMVDHHHLGLALLEEGVERTHVAILRDLSGLTKDEFWTVMDHHQWVHLYDAQGRRQEVSELPKRLTGLQDDPYRSLAGAVAGRGDEHLDPALALVEEARQAGAYAKDHTPFAEFLWADFFRRRISVKANQLNSSTTLQRAVELARSPAAEHLPGWSGASS